MANSEGNIHVDLYILSGVLIQKEGKSTYLVKQCPPGANIQSSFREFHPTQVWKPNYESARKLPTLIKFTKENGAYHTCNLCICKCLFGTQCFMKLDGHEDEIKILEGGRSNCSCKRDVLDTKFIAEGHTGAVMEDHSYLCCNHKLSISVSVPNAPRLTKMDRKETYTIKIQKTYFDIIHVDSLKIEGTVHKTSINGSNAYALRFPEAASQEERMMLIISIIHYDNN